jgi:hypothetical protein
VVANDADAWGSNSFYTLHSDAGLSGRALALASFHADLQARPVDVNDEDAVQQLAQKYQVSTQALTIQLVNLGFARGLF